MSAQNRAQAPTDGTDQRELAPAAVAPTEPGSGLHRGLDLGAAVEAAAVVMATNDYDSWAEPALPRPRAVGDVERFQANYRDYASTVMAAAVPHMLRAVADLLDAGSGEEYDYGPLASPRLRALAEEIAGGGK